MSYAAKIVTRLPCGGRIEIRCPHVVGSVTAVGEDDVDIILVPEVYCAGRYVPGKNCPWLHVLWKFYEGISARQQGSVVDAETMTRLKLQPKILDADGFLAYVFNAQVGSGLVVRGGEVFQDPHFGAVAYKGPYEFACCNDVKTWHARIIAFFKRLLGRRAKG